MTPRILRIVFVVLSIIFLALGLMSLLNTVLGFRTSGGTLWFNLVYTALNFLTSYGLFTEKKWIVPVLGINWVGTIILLQMRLYFSPGSFDIISRDGLMIVLSTAFFWLTYASRRYLSGKYFFAILPALCIVLWLIAFVYNFSLSLRFQFY
mgnify:FL=1